MLSIVLIMRLILWHMLRVIIKRNCKPLAAHRVLALKNMSCWPELVGLWSMVTWLSRIQSNPVLFKKLNLIAD